MRALPGCRRRAFLDRRRDTVVSPPPVRSVRFRSALGSRPRAVTCRRHTDDVSKRVRRVWRTRSFSIRHGAGTLTGLFRNPRWYPQPGYVPPDSFVRLRLRSTHGSIVVFAWSNGVFRRVVVDRPTILDVSQKSFVSDQPRALARSRAVQKNVNIDCVKCSLNST